MWTALIIKIRLSVVLLIDNSFFNELAVSDHLIGVVVNHFQLQVSSVLGIGKKCQYILVCAINSCISLVNVVTCSQPELSALSNTVRNDYRLYHSACQPTDFDHSYILDMALQLHSVSRVTKCSCLNWDDSLNFLTELYRYFNQSYRNQFKSILSKYYIFVKYRD